MTHSTIRRSDQLEAMMIDGAYKKIKSFLLSCINTAVLLQIKWNVYLFLPCKLIMMMHRSKPATLIIFSLLALMLLVSQSTAFAPIVRRVAVKRQNFQRLTRHANSPAFITYRSSGSSLAMALDDDEGPGLLTQVGIVLIMLLFLVTGLLPYLDGGGKDLSIADSVVTQDASAKIQTVENKQDALSRANIQEKLSGIPVFYLSDSQGSMGTTIYLSYADAKVAGDGAGMAVKATSLDQVMYPLILKRGRMRMAPPPPEVQKAEAELANSAENGTPRKSYRLVPSKAAIEQAKEFGMNLKENDIPLFVADRLAFASPRGPQLPLFVDKSDCVFSYERLRGGKQNLPEQPNIRSASLLDELYSMEKGTRAGVAQLAFYATAEDVAKASELLQ